MNTSVVICTDLRAMNRIVGMSRIMTSGSVGGVKIRTLAQNTRDMGLFPTLGKIPPSLS